MGLLGLLLRVVRIRIGNILNILDTLLRVIATHRGVGLVGWGARVGVVAALDVHVVYCHLVLILDLDVPWVLMMLKSLYVVVGLRELGGAATGCMLVSTVMEY